MAEVPVDPIRIIERFGPHLSPMTGVRLSTSVEPDRLVKTHCCFCGQQCGIQLKVRENQVIGFEPWEDFPFNRGMLCPKGVKRYLQGSHPDRLTTALRRDSTSGFAPIPYADAIGRVANEIARLQSARQIRTRLFENAIHRLQRPPLHGERRCGQQESIRDRPYDQSLVRHGGHRCDLGRRFERRRVLADHDQLHVAGA
jgi:anaerobic selenocysteine-containing dehydrogenase